MFSLMVVNLRYIITSYFFIDDYLRDTLGKHKYKIVIETNGVGIQDENIAKEYYERHIGIGLSIDGPRHIHDFQRGRGSYDIAIRALNSLVNAGYKKRGDRCHICNNKV